MTNEQIVNFNKRSFPYHLYLHGKNIYLRKLLLDNLTEEAIDTEPSINLWDVQGEIIFVMQNDLLTKLSITDNILYINV